MVPHPVSVSLPLLVYFSVLLNTEPRLVPQLIPDALPPLHLLDPLLEVGEVRVDVVVRLRLVVGSEQVEFDHYTLHCASLYSLLGQGGVVLTGPGTHSSVEAEEDPPGVLVPDDLTDPRGEAPEDLLYQRLEEGWRIIKIKVFRG